MKTPQSNNATNFSSTVRDFSLSAVPEPTTTALGLLALGGLLLRRRRD